MAQLYFFYSAMNAGKSLSLLKSAHNYESRGMRVLVYTADTRYGIGVVYSRIGVQRTCAPFNDRTDFLSEVIASTTHESAPCACILVDEAQFLTARQVDELARVVDELDIPVLCYGLRTDFQGKAFTGSLRLLEIADKLIEEKTVCSCGRRATMNVRTDTNGNACTEGEQLEIGDAQYVSLCRKHYMEMMRRYCRDT